MASTKFPLLFMSLLITAVLALYIISSKTENEVSKIPEMLSWKDNARIHSNNYASMLRQRLENEDTPSLSYAEKLFKLYDEVETFVGFIGYPRSCHSVVAAILDAHPEIIIAQYYDVMNTYRKYRSAKQKNMQKYQLYFGIHQQSREQAMFGNQASPSHQLKNNQGYSYNVPGAWQGEYKERIKVIGVKRRNPSAVSLNISRVRSFKEIEQAVQAPIKFIHVTRNPFDNIATIMLRATNSRDAVREEGVKIDNKESLDASIKKYFKLAEANQRVRERYGDAVLDIPGHETVLRPRKTLRRLCDHLGVTCSADYIEKCSKILYGTPSVTRNKVVWTEKQKQRVTEMMKNYPFLKEYSFDKYPS